MGCEFECQLCGRHVILFGLDYCHQMTPNDFLLVIGVLLLINNSSPSATTEKVFAWLLGDCEFESRRRNSHPWPGAKNAKFAVFSGQVGYSYSLPCQSAWHWPIVEIGEFMYVEGGRLHFSLSSSLKRCFWLTSCVSEEACACLTLPSWKLLGDGGELARANQLRQSTDSVLFWMHF